MMRKMIKMRLDRVLSNSGFGTRSEIKKIIKNGVVSVDGKTVTDVSLHVDPHRSLIEIDGERLCYRKFLYVMMNKPAGVISATSDIRQKTAVDLLPQKYLSFNLFPAGRLDIDTEGLLLLTNDGQMTHELLSPKKHVDKRYYALVEGLVTQEDVKSFEEGVILDDGYKTMPSELEIIRAGTGSESMPGGGIEPRTAAGTGTASGTGTGIASGTAAGAETGTETGTETGIGTGIGIGTGTGIGIGARPANYSRSVLRSEIELVLHEGKFHQVKRMFEAVGKRVLYLKRIQMGGLKLDEALKPGEFRELTPQEVLLLSSKESVTQV